MKNLIWLAMNNLKVTFGKKKSIFTYFIMPVVFILIPMVLYNNIGSSSIKIGVADKDKSALSSDFAKAIGKQNSLKLTNINHENPKGDIAAGKVDCVITIPQGFEESIYNNSLKKPEILSLKGESSTAWINNYSNIYLRNLLDIWKASKENKQAFNKMYDGLKGSGLSFKSSSVQDTSRGKGMTSQSIGFLIMFMMIGAGSFTEIILKEKKNRTYFRICSAPVSSRIYILGNVISSFIIVAIQAFITLVAMTKLFKIQTYVPFWQMYVILLSFGFVAIGLGILLVAFSKDSTQSNTLMTLIITPSCMISGCFFPVDFMPEAARKIADFLPQRWVISAIEKLQTNSSFSSIYLNLIIILGFAFTFFIVAAYRFSRDENIKNFV
ncbi:ABC-type multidrug transport system, permease component [Clostridium pasteurianum DSM 525 = ATCC 6013]|uniref:Transport permease protein n=1 Tax=Clostridium pasteurianum DSM 525 = ATCC 6013 TaxID=1262449 RepID=A0A0H3J6Z1_CLOPA|nr:ABC transporter permease [Clostridium pasteurianum]AJA48987.1 ABC-type multidrug transport system, permease component [Clostridium pasteurianum DSM 525 = ATCC 6013]AJA52975.1 ABC-type multidrug transport system, permease component [Clostridium pasteurianum DSM 525 = ATCC 6013]AOZ76194.1 multidrug ABC transporter permease [Clostridium pasteurianum DSM 525 = ATCC 6013]AOZ79990.1 multidrug ABC transporter permease [Clostridium pasteurianum]ELP60283.1 ABC-type multidrug transport system, permea